MKWKPVLGKKGIVWARCPWCQLEIQADEGRRVTSHLAPVCEQFLAMMAKVRASHGDAAARPLGPEELDTGEEYN